MIDYNYMLIPTTVFVILMLLTNIASWFLGYIGGRHDYKPRPNSHCPGCGRSFKKLGLNRGSNICFDCRDQI